ncbi:MAG: ABC transporter permease subunit [Methanobacteriota archaeon]|nr:MAG: ABC transporter permease subunit [Euryarchaeota archaeon]
MASARRLVRALSDGDDGTRGPASAVAVRTIPLAPAVPAVAKDLPDRHSAGRHQVPSGIRPPGPHVLGPSSGPPGHSLRGSRDVRCDLGAGRGRRSPRAGPVIPESSTGGGSGTPSGGRFILHSTWAGLRHRPRLDDSNGRVDRTKPARIAIHHPGARGRRVPAGPATALLPIIVGFALIVTASLGPAAELSAILIALFSMQWYLLFNLIAGVRGIPEDLEEAARSFGLRGRAYWRRVLLPAMVPSLLTGSITAWGAGWNALIVSEYIPFLSPPPHVSGLGYLLDIATFRKPLPDNEMILLTILTMIVIVLAMNKLLWRPLYKRAAVKYRVEV